MAAPACNPGIHELEQEDGQVFEPSLKSFPGTVPEICLYLVRLGLEICILNSKLTGASITKTTLWGINTL